MDDEPGSRRARADRQRGSSGALALVLTLCGIGAVLLICLAGIGGTAIYVLFAPREVAQEPVVLVEPDPAPDWFDVPPDMAPLPWKQPLKGPPVELVPAALPAHADERICNGDFEQGAKGFRSAYRHSPLDVRDALTFCVARNPRDAHRDAAPFGDHTTGNGQMLVVNGGNAVDGVLWGQTVTVRPNAVYTFSLYLTSWYATAPAQLEVRINDRAIGRLIAPTQCGRWQEIKMTWRAGADPQAVVEIFNLTRDVSGNDFAIDDISLRGPQPD